MTFKEWLDQARVMGWVVTNDDGTVTIHLPPHVAAQVRAKVQEIKAARSTHPEEETA